MRLLVGQKACPCLPLTKRKSCPNHMGIYTRSRKRKSGNLGENGTSHRCRNHHLNSQRSRKETPPTLVLHRLFPPREAPTYPNLLPCTSHNVNLDRCSVSPTFLACFLSLVLATDVVWAVVGRRALLLSTTICSVLIGPCLTDAGVVVFHGLSL